MSKPVGPDKDLINRAFRIKPLIEDHEGRPHFVTPIDLYEKIYSHDPFGGPQSAGRATGLDLLGTIDVLIPATLWGGSIGGPTIAQVLPQIPAEYLDKTVAFIAHMASGAEEADNGYVRATAELYAGDLPEKVKAQPVIAWKRQYNEPFPTPEPPRETFNAAAATALEEGIVAMKPLELKKNPSTQAPKI